MKIRPLVKAVKPQARFWLLAIFVLIGFGAYAQEQNVQSSGNEGGEIIIPSPAPEQAADVAPMPETSPPVVPEDSVVAETSAEISEDAPPAAVGAGESSVSAEQESAPHFSNELNDGTINPNTIPSLLFTFWEHSAIIDARRSRGSVRPPTDAELAADARFSDEPPDPGERDISLAGIAYVSHNDWTIWLNGQRVTPKAVPEEVLDLKVYNEYIEFKWFDDYTNQILPIRLRPHQRFNIDTKIFLPG